jgi:hypothetical protein
MRGAPVRTRRTDRKELSTIPDQRGVNRPQGAGAAGLPQAENIVRSPTVAAGPPRFRQRLFNLPAHLSAGPD